MYLAGIGRFRARTETEYQFFFPYVIWVHEQAVSNDTHTLWAYFGIEKWMTLFEAVSWMAGWVAAGLGWRLDGRQIHILNPIMWNMDSIRPR